MENNKPTDGPSASNSSAYVGWLILLVGTVAILGLAYFFKP